MSMKESRLKGKRVLAQLRCSLKEKAKKSLEQQHEWLTQYTLDSGAIYVGEMKEAISASQTKRRPDLDRIIKRKQTINDFDTVLVQDLSRLTRGGVEHGLEIYFEFKRLGIQIASIVDGIIDSEDKLIEAARRFQEARATANRNALGHTRGRLKAHSSGRIAYTQNIPFGIDQLITDENGALRYMLRNMRDGTQQMLSQDGSKVLKVYPKNKEGSRLRHIKQHDDYVKLVPGAKDVVEIVRHIFRRWFVDNQRATTIARELNDRHELAPRGGLWGIATVNTILTNPIYVGEAPRGRRSKAIFWECTESGPIPSEVTDVSLGTYRAQSKWIPTFYPNLKNFLGFDPVLTARIAKWQYLRAERLAARISRKRGGDKHIQSAFVFKHILKSKQGGYPFIGHSATHNRNGKRYRVYYISRAVNRPLTDDIYRVKVNAYILEDAILPTIKQVIAGYTGMAAAVKSALSHRTTGPRSDRETALARLRKQRATLLQQFDYWIGNVGSIDKSVVDDKLAGLRQQIREIGEELRNLEAGEGEQTTTGGNIRSAEQLLKTVTKGWDSFPPEVMRNILLILVKKMEIDLLTRRIDLELHLPSWAVNRSEAIRACLEKSTAKDFVYEAHSSWAIFPRKMSFQYTAFPGYRGRAQIKRIA
ncbi:MAG: recombinase family protein [Tepidisphaeraceae bacterium]